ncbi:hypothetical protein BG51_11885 [Pseudomonas [fluorescens] ATCC 17400]
MQGDVQQRQLAVGIGHRHGDFAIGFVNDHHRGVGHHAVGFDVIAEYKQQGNETDSGC